MDLEKLLKIQAEIGEIIAFPNGLITDVHASKTHDKMEKAGDGDMVTDTPPENSYIFSSYGGIKIKRDDAKKMVIGVKMHPYSETKKGKEPESFTLEDLFKKGEKKITPAIAAKRVKDKYKITERNEDIFDAFTDELNRQSRLPLLTGLVGLSEIERETKELEEENPDVSFVARFRKGGKVTSEELDKMIFGGVGKFFGNVAKGVGKGIGAIGKGVKDFGLFGIDNALNLGLGLDVIKDNAYSYGVSKGISNFTGNTLNKIGDVAVPLAANFVAPGLGAAISGGRGFTNALGEGANIGSALGSGLSGAGSSFLGSKLLGSKGGFDNILNNIKDNNITKLFSNNSNTQNPDSDFSFLENILSGKSNNTGIAGGLGNYPGYAGGQFNNTGQVLGQNQGSQLDFLMELLRAAGSLGEGYEKGGNVYEPGIEQAGLGDFLQKAIGFLGKTGSGVGNFLGGAGNTIADAGLIGLSVAQPIVGINNIRGFNNFFDESIADRSSAYDEFIKQRGIGKDFVNQGLGLGTASNILGLATQEAPQIQYADDTSNQIEALRRRSIGEQVSGRNLLDRLAAESRYLPEERRGLAAADRFNALSQYQQSLGNTDNSLAALEDRRAAGITTTDNVNLASRIGLNNQIGKGAFDALGQGLQSRANNEANYAALLGQTALDKNLDLFNLGYAKRDRNSAEENALFNNLLTTFAGIKGLSGISTTNPVSTDSVDTYNKTASANTVKNITPFNNCEFVYGKGFMNKNTGLPCIF